MRCNGLSAEEEAVEEKEEERQHAPGRDSLTQQLETNQGQALAAAGRGASKSLGRKHPKV